MTSHLNEEKQEQKRGYVTNLKRALSGMFFIQGDDGEVYFSHVNYTRDRKNTKKYLYNGNYASFSVVDKGEEHRVAVDVVFDEVEDPNTELKRERRIEEARRQEENRKRKEQNYIKSIEEKIRHNEKTAFEARYQKYMIEIFESGEWVPYTVSDGEDTKFVFFSEASKARDYVREHTSKEARMRIKKAKVVATKRGINVRPL